MTDDGGTDETADDVVGMYEQEDSAEDPFVESSTDSESTDEGSTESEPETPEEDEPKKPRFSAHMPEENTGEPETASGTYYVKYATDSSITLHDVDTAQIFTVIENPGVESNDIIEADLMAQPPMEVSYLVTELHERKTIPVTRSDEPPTQQILEAGERMDVGQAVAIDREGTGEIHVLRVEPNRIEDIPEELEADEMTYKNAARYGVNRVEIRTATEPAIVSIRYLP